MKLNQLQSQFSRHLLYQNVDLAELDVTGPFPVEQLMELYRNNFYISLSQYLEVCFPAVLALVGEEFFAQLAKAYIKQSPLDKPELDFFGAQFSCFIKKAEQTQSLIYLADVATLDWAFDNAKTVNNTEDFPFEQLSQLDQQQQLSIIFQLASKTVLIKAQYPLLKIWQGAKSGDLDDIDMLENDHVVLHPDRQGGVSYFSVSEKQYQFLLNIKDHKRLGQLSESTDFNHHLNNFISLNIINNFRLEEEV